MMVELENTRKVEYVLFDMDGRSQISISAYIQPSDDLLSQGLMIDSERIYTIATS